ncbi:hypothetical protein [Phenylobacterium sp.]|uniref:hypothetical protein n=1 Tax=Phenylobacterium sp. TaxID=1871053 RepID=UPI0017E4AD78|nr:hypothetical protein [Phenylobacterium sp.]MBA4795558.1 VanZ family protein [Phenylobacterium sp.]MBC7166339.1 VanZ family protein [Phenylobacterium sp.]
MVFRSPLPPRLLRGLFVLLLAAVIYLSIAPGEATPTAGLFWDKAQHAIAYAVLGLAGLAAFGGRWPVLVALLAVSGGLEIAQALTPFGRQGDLRDLAANAGGLLLALLAWRLGQRLRAAG